MNKGSWNKNLLSEKKKIGKNFILEDLIKKILKYLSDEWVRGEIRRNKEKFDLEVIN